MKDNGSRKSGTKQGLRILPGGLLHEVPESAGLFVSAEATDTRLMGVTGLHMIRHKEGIPFHQFFLLDADEYNLDDYNSIYTDSEKDAGAIGTAMFGALGGKMVPVTEREAFFLVSQYMKRSLHLYQSLPEPAEEYMYMSYAAVPFAPGQTMKLIEKLSARITCDAELINYYIMRCCGMDEPAQAYLCGGSALNDVFRLNTPGTLYKNDITRIGEKKYNVESLIESDEEYMITRTVVETAADKIKSIASLSCLTVSPWEASLILRRPEYIIYGTSPGEPDDYSEIMFSIFRSVTVNPHEFGILYMIFREENDHAKSSHYRLDHDVLASVLILDCGEIVVAGSDPQMTAVIAGTMDTVAERPASGRGKAGFKEMGSIKFGEPVIGIFLESGFESFMEYVALYNEQPNK